MTEADTVIRLTRLLQAGVPFLHVRFGDGDVFFMSNTGPRLTADGEEWTPLLAGRLNAAWRRIATAPNLLLGDVETYAVSDGCEREWRRLLAELTALRCVEPELVHIEALRAGLGFALPFYEAAARDERPKVFVGPERLAGAAEMLDADHIHVPLYVSHEHAERVAADVAGGDYAVAFFAAGRGGKIMQGLLADDAPRLTQVDVGSGLDLLFGGVERGTDRGIDAEAVRDTYRAAGLRVNA